MLKSPRSGGVYAIPNTAAVLRTPVWSFCSVIAGGDPTFFERDFHVIQGRKYSIRTSFAVMRATISAYGRFCDAAQIVWYDYGKDYS